jgi:hypothetical protein
VIPTLILYALGALILLVVALVIVNLAKRGNPTW